MRRCGIASVGSLLLTLASALRYDQQYVGYNLNTNETAVDRLTTGELGPTMNTMPLLPIGVCQCTLFSLTALLTGTCLAIDRLFGY